MEVSNFFEMRIIACCDIDGTQTGDRHALHRFNKIWLSLFQPNGSILIHNTGRTYSSFEFLKEKLWPILDADIVICSDGTEIRWKIDGYKLDQEWHSYITKNWRRSELEATMNRYGDYVYLSGDLIRHEVVFQKKNEADIALLAFQKRHPESSFLLLQMNWDSTGEFCENTASSPRYLITASPKVSGKGRALDYCVQKLKFSSENVVWCADGINDWSFLHTEYKGILVGNAVLELVKKLKQQYRDNLHYHASGRHAQGIIEGLAHFGWISQELTSVDWLRRYQIHRVLIGMSLLCLFHSKFIVLKNQKRNRKLL